MKRYASWIGSVVLVVALVTSTVITAQAIATLWRERDGRCRCDTPREVVGGFLWSQGGGMFNSPITTYNLRCAGTYEHSGRPCVSWYQVTEAEYDRRMYQSDGE